MIIIGIEDELAELVLMLADRIRDVRALTGESVSAEPEPDRWLNEPEAAEAARISVDALRAHRRRGTGPDNRPHRGRVLYRRLDVLAWAARKLGRTSGRDAIDDASDGA